MADALESLVFGDVNSIEAKDRAHEQAMEFHIYKSQSAQEQDIVANERPHNNKKKTEIYNNCYS